MLQRIFRGTFFLFLVMVSINLTGQDTLKPRSWSLNGYLKDMPSVLFSRIDGRWLVENLVHNRLNFKWHISPLFTTGIEMRNRLSFGTMKEEFPQYYDAFGYDNGVVDLSWNIFSGEYCVLNTSLDRLWIDFSKGRYQLTLGRQRVNWGLNYVWNPNDIFNTYSYLDFDYEEKPGSDAVRFQFYPKSTGRAEFTVKAAKDWRVTAAALYQFNLWKWDFQVICGFMDGSDLAIGGGWSGQIAKGGFRGEASWFRPMLNDRDTNGILVASLGYDYTFRNSLMLQFEALYNGNPNGNLSTLLLADQASASAMNAKNPFLSDFSVFGGITYPPTPLFSLSLAGIWNWDNGTYIIIPSGTFSVATNMELMLLAQVFRIYDRTYPVDGINFIFLRYKWSF